MKRLSGPETPAADSGVGLYFNGAYVGSSSLGGRNFKAVDYFDVEAVVTMLPQVALAAVIGRNDEKWGERPLLIVEVRENQFISDDDLLGALRDRVASWWVPDAVVRIPAMPLAAAGKIDKIGLRKSFG